MTAIPLHRCLPYCRLLCLVIGATLTWGVQTGGGQAIDYSEQLPRIPPLSPSEAIGSFDVEPELAVEQTAAEPLVTDPVAMCFDERGDLYVAEMCDYSEQDQAMLGRVRRLRDEDHDGRFDASTIFADGLSWPTAIICFRGGVFVGAAPHIYYLKDDDDDGQADRQTLVFTGFGRTNVQGLLNSFRWGLDHRIHGATSSSGADVTCPPHPDRAAISLRGRDFSFDPDSLELRPESGGAQHGMDFDDWGQKFVCSNSDHAQFVMYRDHYVSRNPLLAAPNPRMSIAEDGGQGPVYRTSPVEPWRIVRTRLRVEGLVPGPVEGGGTPAGYFTGSTGITIFRGDAIPLLHGMAIVGDVGSNIVHRKQLIASGTGYIARRIDDHTELLRSRDIWFRPVQFANGPDGCLHVLDMYREVIEHPASLPPEIKQHLDLTSGRDRGRLYRLVQRGLPSRAAEDLGRLTSNELTRMLGHENSWHAETASRLLWERQDVSVSDQLRNSLRSIDSATGRMRSLWALQGLGQLIVDDVLVSLGDRHPRVREHAIRLSEAFEDDLQIQQQLHALANDQDARLVLQLAFSLGEFPVPWRVTVLRELSQRDDLDAWHRMAILSSCGDCDAQLLMELTKRSSSDATSNSGLLICELARQLSRRGDAASWSAVTDAVMAVQENAALTAAILEAAISANRQFQQQLAQPAVRNAFDTMLHQARSVLEADTSTAATRLGAARFLALSEDPSDADRLLTLLDHRAPGDLQRMALRSVANFERREVAERILERWSSLSPQVRAEAEEVLFSRAIWTEATFDAIANGRIGIGDIGRARIAQAQQHALPSVRDAAKKMLARFADSDDGKLTRRMNTILLLSGDGTGGRTTFRKHCATCHRLENVGYEIGPNLATVKNRGREAVLTNVLDPNREVNPAYLNYIITTTDGRTRTGIIEAETSTSVTLRRAEDQREVVLREDVEALHSSGMSLMPEDIVRDLADQDVANLLEYILNTP
ncbi:MAG: c-type cytochrome [Pirellulaceae bacterium]|nr:c-type cytochrome [Planctomycetales bacterium]